MWMAIFCVEKLATGMLEIEPMQTIAKPMQNQCKPMQTNVNQCKPMQTKVNQCKTNANQCKKQCKPMRAWVRTRAQPMRAPMAMPPPISSYLGVGRPWRCNRILAAIASNLRQEFMKLVECDPESLFLFARVAFFPKLLSAAGVFTV